MTPLRALALLTLLALAACGADGAPSAPDGVTITGSVAMGVARDGG